METNIIYNEDFSMKILVFGDCHWSTYSSILRKRGLNYSTRLHNLIDSINWVEEQAIENHVDVVVGLGDFFDKEKIKLYRYFYTE